uniref:Uncharacterized protein n=1 Tax=Pavo cristatus TaxID=9049 RepID=A0A8C9FS99_PAVCR
ETANLRFSTLFILILESCICAEVVAAVDVNTLANEVYKHNFPSTPLWAKTIEGITLKEFDRLSFDMILMSPPCQPFTRSHSFLMAFHRTLPHVWT